MPDKRKSNALPPKKALTFRFELAIGASLSANDRCDVFFEYTVLGHLRRECGAETDSPENQPTIRFMPLRLRSCALLCIKLDTSNALHEVEIAAPDPN